MSFEPNDALKVVPGKMYELYGTHMIKKPVPHGFDCIVSLYDNGDAIQYQKLSEGDCLFVIGLAPSPFNEDTFALQNNKMYPTIHVWYKGKDYVIRQHKLLCGLYHELV